ncbi:MULTISPECIES: hypothetical protein [unclassified Methylobacterium]|uniref:hypothetical protein n=1 Tax=unclassified Methylobacterium TaxID=2615210 RepID=UPI00226AC1AB|nr:MULTISPECIES: hypothetical protein [unclassified Methylobacterium]
MLTSQEALVQNLIDNANKHRLNFEPMSTDEQVAYLRRKAKTANIIAGLMIVGTAPDTSVRTTFIRGMDAPQGASALALWVNEYSLALIRIAYGTGEREHEARVALRRENKLALDRIATWLAPANQGLLGVHLGIALNDPTYAGGPAELRAAIRYVAARNQA